MGARSVSVPLVHAARHAPGDADELYSGTFGDFLLARHDWYPRRRITGTSTPVTGQMFLMYFSAYDDGPYTKLGWIVTSAGATITLCRLGLYTVAANGDLTLAARTANDATIATSSGEVTRSMDAAGGFPTSLSLTIGARYAAASVTVGTTMPTLATASLGTGQVAAVAPRLEGFINSQTDLPTSIVAATVGSGSTIVWGELLA